MTPSQAISKLKQANAGSRDLDADFFEALGHRVVRAAATRHSWRYLDGRYWYALPMVTVDLDDITRFATRAGLTWSVGVWRKDAGQAHVHWPSDREIHYCMHYAATPALALAVAVLRAHLRREKP